MLIYRILMGCLLLFLISTTSQALPTDGSCSKHDFSKIMDESGDIKTNQIARVLRRHAPVYQYANSSKPIQKLRFGDSVIPVRLNSGRIQVKRVGRTGSLGWMNKHDLLCGVDPLQSEKGLDRKVFIKTPDSQSNNPKTVPAYLSYKDGCGGRCNQLSRFRLYFVFAEDQDNQLT